MFDEQLFMSTHITKLCGVAFSTIFTISNAFSSICLKNRRKWLSMHLHLVLIIVIVFCMGCPTTTLCREFWTPLPAGVVSNAQGFATFHPVWFALVTCWSSDTKQFTASCLCDLLIFKSSLYNLRSAVFYFLRRLFDWRVRWVTKFSSGSSAHAHSGTLFKRPSCDYYCQ